MFAGPSFLDKPFVLYEAARFDKYMFQWSAWGCFVVALYMHHAFVHEDLDGSDRPPRTELEDFDPRIRATGSSPERWQGSRVVGCTVHMSGVGSGWWRSDRFGLVCQVLTFRCMVSFVCVTGSLPWSRAFVYLGSLLILAASMVISLPDYIQAADLFHMLPHCAPRFDLLVRGCVRALFFWVQVILMLCCHSARIYAVIRIVFGNCTLRSRRSTRSFG